MKHWLTHSYYRQTDTTADIASRMECLLSELAIDYFSYLVIKPPQGVRFDATAMVQTSYPVEWITRYMAKRYEQLDPVCELAINATRPYYWGQGLFLRRFKKPQRAVFDEAHEFHISHGLAIPVRGARGELAVFNVVSSDEKRLADATRGAHEQLFQAAFDTHDIVMGEHQSCGNGSIESIELSEREKECLLWTLEGKTAGDIAVILGLSVYTVNRYASTAAQKMGSANKHHAAVQALRAGLIC